MKNRILMLILITLFIVPLNAIAATGDVAATDIQSLLISPMISYQGRLLDSSGNPVDGTLTMTFKLYDASTGGNLVWSETKSIVVSKGLFNTNLGSSTALNVANFDQALWLEIVAGTETLTPRQKLLASPYALSLAPGASVKGNQYTPVLTVNNSYGDGLKGISKYGKGLYGDGQYGVYGDGYYGVWGNATGYGLVGLGTYNGIYGYGREGTGVYGSSYNSTGASFSTTNGYYGLTASQYGKYGGYGVYAYSKEGTGVYGNSWNGTGGYFSSSNGYYGVQGYGSRGYGGVFTGYGGLYASGYPGYAGYFSGNVYVAGNIYKSGSVSFVEDHPTDPTKQIVYVSLEGGENGVYIRGSAQLNNGEATVKLPEHFSLVASQEGLTVQVTPTGETRGLFIVSKSPTEIVVKEIGGGTSGVTFDYLVNGIRKGHENYQPIQDRLPNAPEPVMPKEPIDRQSQPTEPPVPVEPPTLPAQLENPPVLQNEVAK